MMKRDLRNSLQDLDPRIQGRRRDFGKVIPADKSNKPAMQSGKSRGLRHFARRLVRPSTMRQEDRSLTITSQVRPRRIEIWIAEAIVDRFQTGRAAIAQMTDLNRRGLIREEWQTVSRPCATRDPRGCRCHRCARSRRPAHRGCPPDRAIDHRANGTDRSRRRRARHLIAIDAKRLAVVLPEQREKIVTDDVLAKIRRDIADPQWTLRRTVVQVLRDLRLERFGMAPIPLQAFLENALRRGCGMKTETIDDVAMGLGAAGRQCECAPVPLERLVYLSLVPGIGHPGYCRSRSERGSNPRLRAKPRWQSRLHRKREGHWRDCSGHSHHPDQAQRPFDKRRLLPLQRPEAYKAFPRL